MTEYGIAIVNEVYPAVAIQGAAKELMESVNNFMAEGWRPIGGVSVVTQSALGPGDRIVMTQAMIRELPERLESED